MMRRSRSPSPPRVRARVPRARSWSPPCTIPVQALARPFRNDKRRFSDAFSDDSSCFLALSELLDRYDNELKWSDDDWEQDPGLDTMLDGEQCGGGTSTPLYDFTVQSLQPRCNWRNVIDKASKFSWNNTENPTGVTILEEKSLRLFAVAFNDRSTQTTHYNHITLSIS